MDSKFFKLCLKKNRRGNFCTTRRKQNAIVDQRSKFNAWRLFYFFEMESKGNGSVSWKYGFSPFFFTNIEHRDVQEIFQFQKKNNTEIFLTHFAHTTGMI